jgi:hypothetical protein
LRQADVECPQFQKGCKQADLMLPYSSIPHHISSMFATLRTDTFCTSIQRFILGPRMEVGCACISAVPYQPCSHITIARKDAQILLSQRMGVTADGCETLPQGWRKQLPVRGVGSRSYSFNVPRY